MAMLNNQRVRIFGICGEWYVGDISRLINFKCSDIRIYWSSIFNGMISDSNCEGISNYIILYVFFMGDPQVTIGSNTKIVYNMSVICLYNDLDDLVAGPF